MLKRQDNPIDRHVGNRVRMARIAATMSQEQLGEKLGLTFQQIQKYEKGTNRIAPSRLQVVADVTNHPVAWFFEGQPGGNGQKQEPSPVEIMAATKEGKMLAEAWNSITNRAVRHSLLALVMSIAGGEAED